MKAHIGVDAQSGQARSVIGTSANVNDVTLAGALLHGEETAAFGDAGYQGVDKRQEAQGPHWHVAMQPGKIKQLDAKHPWAQMREEAAQFKASVRAKIEHPFHVIKNLLGHKKARYKGMIKNEAHLFGLFGLDNLDCQEIAAGRSCPRRILNTRIGLERGEKTPRGRPVRSNIDCLRATIALSWRHVVRRAKAFIDQRSLAAELPG